MNKWHDHNINNDTQVSILAFQSIGMCYSVLVLNQKTFKRHEIGVQI